MQDIGLYVYCLATCFHPSVPIRLCELLVVKCKRLRKISLKTGRSDSAQEHQQQNQKLNEIGDSLARSGGGGGVQLVVDYDDVIHDREIRFDNGWIVKIGRGLDIFKGEGGNVLASSYES